ncbi:terminase small subunit [Clostridium cadaveris]|uniref:terminase small subunit n=2 Tax=Clostridium cadaveris TaxID=1529 RepID=UPI00145937F6|nr:terminase small subunit [Clostridium cadaveris]NME65825.1 terminase small subunit [Clostridium cadaveris]UFH65576.1 terminase small subunit [Clostridium cadaveris]
MAKLTEKQQRFVEEYLIDLNATQAAIRAGYKPSSARQVGTENMSKPSIRACIDQAIAERSKRTGINQDRVIRELARLAFVNASDVIDMDEASIKCNASEDDTAAIASVKVKTIPTKEGDGVEREIRLNDKLKALELLGKHLGMFKDNININANVSSTKKLDAILEQLGDDGNE